jgi:ribonucleotide reductase beta subunit family protein with ferritin-like domain
LRQGQARAIRSQFVRKHLPIRALSAVRATFGGPPRTESKELWDNMANAANQVPTLSELYGRWEREHWSARSVDFTDDRRDWLNLADDERWQWYWLAGFAHFRKSETHAIISLSMLMPCLRSAEQQRVLGTQVAGESRHADFFERFHEQVLLAALPTAKQGPLTISAAYQELFIDSLTDIIRKAVDKPSDANLASAVLQLFIILEGSIALATFSVVRRLLAKTGRFCCAKRPMATSSLRGTANRPTC